MEFEVSLDVMKRLIDGLVREFLTHKKYTRTLEIFNQENPKTPDGICTKKELTESLHLNKEIKINKQRSLILK
jgi:hypothetical protein